MESERLYGDVINFPLAEPELVLQGCRTPPNSQLRLIPVDLRNDTSIRIKKCQSRCLKRSQWRNWNLLVSLRNIPSFRMRTCSTRSEVFVWPNVIVKLFGNVQLCKPQLVGQGVLNALKDRIRFCHLVVRIHLLVKSKCRSRCLKRSYQMFL